MTPKDLSNVNCVRREGRHTPERKEFVGVTNSVLSYLACSFGANQSTHSERYPLSETLVKGSFCSNTENPVWFKSDH